MERAVLAETTKAWHVSCPERCPQYNADIPKEICSITYHSGTAPAFLLDEKGACNKICQQEERTYATVINAKLSLKFATIVFRATSV